MPSYLKNQKLCQSEILRSIYFAMSDSHLNYANLIWTQNPDEIQEIKIKPSK